MADSVIGVDFGSSGIKLAEVRTVKGISTVTKQAYLPLDPGMIMDGGPVADRAAGIATELKSLLAAQKFTAKDAVMGYGSTDDIFVNRAMAPWHTPKDFKTAVGFDIIADKSLLLGAPEGVLIDAVVFEEVLDFNDNKKLDVLLCGVNPRLADIQATIVQKAGLHVAGADLSALAALRAVNPFPRPPDSLDVLVDIGQDVMTVLIHENGKPYAITLQAGVAGSAASSIISEEIQDDDQERIDRAKITHSRNYLVRRAADDYSFKVITAIRGAIQSYFNLRNGPATIAGITLVGGGSLLHGLRESLEAGMKVDVVLGALDPAIGGSPERLYQGPQLAHDYTVAIGLGMGVLA